MLDNGPWCIDRIQCIQLGLDGGGRKGFPNATCEVQYLTGILSMCESDREGGVSSATEVSRGMFRSAIRASGWRIRGAAGDRKGIAPSPPETPAQGRLIVTNHLRAER